MDEEKFSTPELVCQISNLPDEGVDMEGDVDFASLGIYPDDRFQLPHPLHFKLHVELARQDVIVRGELEADLMAMCDRCAEMADLRLYTDDVVHSYKNVSGQPVDLTEDIREDILITFPQCFHCSDDCKGLCSVCGQNLNLGDCSCPKGGNGDEEDPWKALSTLDLE